MKLFYRSFGEGSPLIILHGLFGSSDNWLSIGKVLAEKYKVYLLDQRNHGQSPHNDTFNYEVMAEDLYKFITEHNIQLPIIIGHSMGGKVAMQFCVNYPELWKKLIVVDIAPKAYSVHHDTILKGLNSINTTMLDSRGQADKQLAAFVPEIGVRQFLLKNLAREEEGFKWKINLSVITRDIEIIGAGLKGQLSIQKPVLFINGATSNYIQLGDKVLMEEKFPGCKLMTIEEAGHWVHAEKPEEFLSTVNDFLTK